MVSTEHISYRNTRVSITSATEQLQYQVNIVKNITWNQLCTKEKKEKVAINVHKPTLV